MVRYKPLTSPALSGRVSAGTEDYSLHSGERAERIATGWAPTSYKLEL